MKISKITKLVNGNYSGKDNIDITNISSSNHPKPNSIIWVSNNKNIVNIPDSDDIVILGSSDIEAHGKNFLAVENSRLAFALITRIFKKELNFFKNYPASKDSSITYGKDCLFGKNVTIESNVSIGKNVFLGHNVVLHEGVVIGNNVVIESGTIVGSEGFGNVLTPNNEWEHISHLGSVKIKDNVRIGSNCSIDRGTIDDTIISKGVIIDNLVHIAHNVFIGENTAIAAKVGIAGSCIIGKRNMIGGMVGIVDHIVTADDVVISATSTVNKSILEPGTYSGIMPITKHILWKRIAFWITKLDKISKLLNLRKI